MWVLHRLAGDFWPVDRSPIAPNLDASLIALTAAWLVGRKAVRALHAKLDGHAEQMRRLERRLRGDNE